MSDANFFTNKLNPIEPVFNEAKREYPTHAHEYNPFRHMVINEIRTDDPRAAADIATLALIDLAIADRKLDGADATSAMIMYNDAIYCMREANKLGFIDPALNDIAIRVHNKLPHVELTKI